MGADAGGWVEEMLGAIEVEPWIDAGPPSPGLEFSEVLGRRVRTGPWEDQKVSTYDKIRSAIEDGDFERAAVFVDFFADEAEVIYGFFRQLVPDANDFLRERGVSLDDLREANTRILERLRLPDGRPFKARRLWEEFRAQRRTLMTLCGAASRGDALRVLDDFKETWRIIQDRDVDHLYGLINEAVERWGEEALEDFWGHIIGPLFATRYAKFDVSKLPWEDSLWTNIYLAFEAMRGHLVGPGRLGNMEFVEDEDRFTWRFDPCGSGGRAMRGDEIEGSPPRMEPPFNYGVTKQKHDFAWNKEGVCYYCSNCCLVMQLMPIDHFGYPVRVVEPPTYPSDAGAKCTWHVYKDPTKVPERFYQDVGRKKPSSFGSKELEG